MTNIPSSFTIPGTFVTIQGTGTATTGVQNVVLFAASTSLDAGSGATFDITSTDAVTYIPKAISLNSGGKSYAVGDQLTIVNAGTIKVTAVDTNGAITTYTTVLSNNALVSNMAATGVNGTGGKGSGATFDVTSTSQNAYSVDTVQINNAGSGYHVGDQFVINGGTVSVLSVNGAGGVLTLQFTASNNVLSTDPASTNVSATATETISGPVNQLTYASSQADIDATFGTGSDISLMYSRYRSVDTVLPVYVLCSESDSSADIQTALASIAEASFSVIVSPFNSSSALQVFDTFFSTRYGYAQELYGIHVSAKSDTVANLISYGATVNSQYSTVCAFSTGSVDSDILKAAAVGAVIAPSLASDPSIPLQLLKLDVTASGNGFSIPDRLSLFNAGLATTREDSAGDVYLERSRTTYQTNADGVTDNTYQDTETLPQVALVSETFRTGVNSVYFTNGMKLAKDTDQVISGQNIATPSAIKATLISLYKNMVSSGLVTDSDTFSSNVTVSIVRTGVVSVYAPVTLIEQLRQIDININFTK